MWTAEDRERYKDDGRRYPSDLTDAEWELVRSLFETYRTLTRNIRAMVWTASRGVEGWDQNVTRPRAW